MKRLSLLLLLISLCSYAQEGGFAIDANYFYGNIIPHNKTIKHLITGHPDGVLLSFNSRTFGQKEWHQAYNFPDVGFSLHYEDLKNSSLGEMYGLYGHYNFYFLNRTLQLRIAQGLAYNTNPYDRETNFRNYAYGMHLMPSTYFLLNYDKLAIWNGLGVKAGLLFVHHSNANIKAPNTSTNTFAINAGVSYSFGEKQERITTIKDSVFNYSERIKYNIVFRGGVNESDVIGSRQYGYYAVSAYADKRIGRYSAFQLGGDFFWPKYLKEYIAYKSVSYPEENIKAGTDYRKAGVFAGYELFINRFSAEAQAGAYVYAPFKEPGTLYQRVGLKYYAYKNIFAAMTLKTHGAKAEVLEFGVGIRL